MEENIVNADLDLVQAKNAVLARRHMRSDLSSTSWGNRVLVSVSRRQSVLKRAMKVARYASEVRAARVEALRAQIEAGIYQVDSTALAQKMLGMGESSRRDGVTDVDIPAEDS